MREMKRQFLVPLAAAVTFRVIPTLRSAYEAGSATILFAPTEVSTIEESDILSGDS